MVLRTAEGLDALAVRRAGLVDVAGDRGGADEGHGLDVGMGEEGVDRLLVAVDDAEDAVGQAGLLPQRGDGVDRRRVLLARLDDDGVAARDRDGHEPQRHHRREVERADDRHDAQALAHRVDVDLRRGVLGEAALEQVRDAAGELGDLEAAGHLAERVGEDLAVLGGDEGGDVLLALVEQLAEREEDLGALGQRDVAPLLASRPAWPWRRPRRRARLDARSRTPVCSPVAGLKTGLVRSAVPSQGAPARRWVMRLGVVLTAIGPCRAKWWIQCASAGAACDIGAWRGFGLRNPKARLRVRCRRAGRRRRWPSTVRRHRDPPWTRSAAASTAAATSPSGG